MNIHIDPAWLQASPYLVPLVALLLLSSSSEQVAVAGIMLSIVTACLWIGHLSHEYYTTGMLEYRSALGLAHTTSNWLCASYVIVSVLWGLYCEAKRSEAAKKEQTKQ